MNRAPAPAGHRQAAGTPGPCRPDPRMTSGDCGQPPSFRSAAGGPCGAAILRPRATIPPSYEGLEPHLIARSETEPKNRVDLSPLENTGLMEFNFMDYLSPLVVGEIEAKRFLEDPAWDKLSGAEQIDRKGAEIINGYKGRLNLNNLKAISDDVAEILGRHVGMLEMDGLTSISRSQAKNLSGVYGGLSLGGIESISPEIALHLSETRGELKLDGLEYIDFDIFKILMGHRASLRLCGLQSLPSKLFESVHKFEGVELSLNGLRRGIPNIQSNESQIFFFNGIQTLDEDDLIQVQWFSEGRVVLNGIRSIDPVSLRFLSEAGCNFTLKGLSEVSNELLYCLIACPRIEFDKRWRIQGDIEKACEKHGELFFWDGGCMLAIDGGAILVGIDDGAPDYATAIISCDKWIQGITPAIGSTVESNTKKYKIEYISPSDTPGGEIKMRVS